jgi:hypothetical protein
MCSERELVDQSFLLNSFKEVSIGPRFARVPGRAFLFSASNAHFIVSSLMSQRCLFSNEHSRGELPRERERSDRD